MWVVTYFQSSKAAMSEISPKSTAKNTAEGLLLVSRWFEPVSPQLNR
jgi:hypothetical protein